ncbi:MAG: FHA domain-containing protein [Polyangiales bacterium]
MHAFVRFRTPSGASVDLQHGDIIGRLKGAALCVDDPRVSEAHAMVSVRRGELVLLSLRRMFSVRGKPLGEAVLRDGMAIDLAEGVTLTVEDVHVPDRVLALSIDGLETTILPATASLSIGPPIALHPRFEPDADLHLWWNGHDWHAQLKTGAPVAVSDGSQLAVGGANARFELVPNRGSETTALAAATSNPLSVIAWFDTVEIHRDGHPAVTISGVGARLLSELVAFDGPVEWQVAAREVWTDGIELDELRHRWDVTLARLRAKLREAGVRADLVRSTGAGLVQLVRYPADRFDDRR